MARGSLDFAREDVNPATGRASRVVTTEAWVRDYIGGSPAPAVKPELYVTTKSWKEELQPPASSESYWQEIAEGQAIELLRLRAELAKLKRR